MHTMKGTVKNGQIALEQPISWPEGTEVRIRPIPPPAAEEEAGTIDDEQADDPESIASWIAEFDAIPPLQMTPDEEAEWQAARESQREIEKANLVRRVLEIGKSTE